MSSNGARRRLAAIMFADIVDYTATMARSEELGLRVRERHREALRPQVERWHGDWIDETGDESLSCFPGALDAVNCALSVQADHGFATQTAALESEIRFTSYTRSR